MKNIVYTNFLLLILLLFFNNLSYSQDPCLNVTSISCNNNISVDFTSGNGDVAYPVNMSTCNSVNVQGGKEQIYSFTPTITGVYDFEVTSVTGVTYIQYMYKLASQGCNNQNWNCINRTNSTGSIGALSLQSGVTYLLLLNSESTTATSQTFKINCGFNVCNSILPISCGSPTTFGPITGYGDPYYPINISTCNGINMQGGKEQIYTFAPTASGTYQIEVTSANGGYVQYMYKQVSLGCDNLNWNCINRTSSVGPLGAINLQGGTTYYILLNSESTTSLNQTFKINCGFNVCSSILPISCGISTTFGPIIGYGDPSYPTNTSTCNGVNMQGGKEQIYTFTPAVSGTYEFEVTSANGEYVQYMYKQGNLGCDNQNWNCINRTNSTGSLGAINLLGGTTYYILLNYESTNTTSQIFKINCGFNVCSSILPISCGTSTTFGPIIGYGDPTYPVNTSTCNGVNMQGGKEQIYELPSSSTSYQVQISSTSGGYIQYMWKSSSNGCSSTGWNCLDRRNTNGNITALIPASNTSIYLMLNSESTNVSSTTTFQVVCSSLSNNDESYIDNPIIIYPNPVNSDLHIDFFANHEVNKILIRDILGNMVFVENSNNDNLNVENLKKGLYILQVFVDNKIFEKLFVKN